MAFIVALGRALSGLAAPGLAWRREDGRPATPPPFGQIKQQLTQRLQQEQNRKLVGELRAKPKVE